MGLRLDKVFFKTSPVTVEAFGSFVNGGWPSGASSVNVGVLFKDAAPAREHSLVGFSNRIGHSAAPHEALTREGLSRVEGDSRGVVGRPHTPPPLHRACLPQALRAERGCPPLRRGARFSASARLLRPRRPLLPTRPLPAQVAGREGTGRETLGAVSSLPVATDAREFPSDSVSPCASQPPGPALQAPSHLSESPARPRGVRGDRRPRALRAEGGSRHREDSPRRARGRADPERAVGGESGEGVLPLLRLQVQRKRDNGRGSGGWWTWPAEATRSSKRETETC